MNNLQDGSFNRRYRQSKSVERLPRIDQRVFWDSEQAYFNRDLEDSRAPQYVDRNNVLMMPDQTLPYEKASFIGQENSDENNRYTSDQSHIYHKPYYSKSRPKIIPVSTFIKPAPQDSSPILPTEVRKKPINSEKDALIKALQKQTMLLQLLNDQLEDRPGFNRNLHSNQYRAKGEGYEPKGSASGRGSSTKKRDENHNGLDPHALRMDLNNSITRRRSLNKDVSPIAQCYQILKETNLMLHRTFQIRVLEEVILDQAVNKKSKN